MILDVSHLNDECFDEVVAHATRPFVASHSNSRAVCGVKRNLTDDQFRTIRDMGGIVGLNYCSEFLSNDATDKTTADVTFDQLAAISNTGSTWAAKMSSHSAATGTAPRCPLSSPMPARCPNSRTCSPSTLARP